ncbi:MAG TPA: sigma-70 family RNA polymerase sigma factor [Fimbriimonadaceae bacterium]|nr:sigma-70 family RNA polymerase sigma factor [Fimbriimonadaceae bacterium]
MTEEQSLLGAKTGSEDVERAIGLYRDRVFRLALAIVGDRDLAEDVAQETLVRAYRARKTLKDSASAEAWLRKICVRQGLNALRRRRLFGLGEEVAGDENATSDVEVRQVLASLAPEHAVILALVQFEGLSYREASEALGIPEGTVASRLNAARSAFKAAWEGAE